MPRRMTEKERQAFLAEPHIGVLSVAAGDDDRPPHTTPVWYGYEPGGSITFFPGTQGRKSRKAGFIETAGVLSLTVQREEFSTSTSPSRAPLSGRTVLLPQSRCSPSPGDTCPRRLPRDLSRRSSPIQDQGPCSSRSGRTAG